MDLKWLLVRRIVSVALVCLLVGSILAVYGTAREARLQNESLLDLASRQVNLQISRISRSTDIPARFPDWDIIANLTLQPGQCVAFHKPDGDVRRSICVGFDEASLNMPKWFLPIFDVFGRSSHGSQRAISHNGVAQGTVVVDYARIATASRAWEKILPLIGFSSVLVGVLCLVIYIAIERALRPTQAIVSGLSRLGSGDLSYRLPAFQLSDFNRISAGFNRLSEDLSRATMERRDLARRLVDAQEQERRHIARELHDDIAQKLSAMGAHAACVRTEAERNAPQLGASARELEAMCSKLMVSLRQTLSYLRPQEIDDLGLAQSLKDMVADFNRRAAGRTICSIEVVSDVGHLGAETCAHVYRIVQEALANVSKHAEARTVSVRLREQAVGGTETINLSVIDDGTGQKREGAQAPHAAAGMIGMRERVFALNGSIVAGPLASGGFGLQIAFPAKPRHSQAEASS